MEALERENNAKEALGMNDSGRGGGAGNNSSSISTREEDDDNDDGEGEQEEEEEEEREKSSGGGGGGARGGGGGSDRADGTEGARDNGEEEEAAATAAVRDRFAAMKRAVESKVSEVEREGGGGVAHNTKNAKTYLLLLPRQCESEKATLPPRNQRCWYAL